MSERAEVSGPVEAKATHVQWGKLPIENLNPLLDRQLVVGDRIMVARVLLKKGCVVPMHHHQNEQVSYVESGAMEFTVSGERITLRAGEFLCIPPNAPHTAVALEDTIDIDLFTPPRQDWLDKADQYLRG